MHVHVWIQHSIIIYKQCSPLATILDFGGRGLGRVWDYIKGFTCYVNKIPVFSHRGPTILNGAGGKATTQWGVCVCVCLDYELRRYLYISKTYMYMYRS